MSFMNSTGQGGQPAAGGMGGFASILQGFGALTSMMGGMQVARGYEQEGMDKAASYEDLAAQFDTRAKSHIPLAQRKAGEVKRLTHKLEGNARARMCGGAGDPSSVKFISKLRTAGYYQAMLQMAAGEQSKENDLASGRYARAAGARARAAGMAAGSAARTGAFGSLLKGMGKNLTLGQKYGQPTVPAAPQGAYSHADSASIDWDLY